MGILIFVAGFTAGSIFTAVLGFLYIRHRMKAQLGIMENQMESLMETTEDLTEDLDMQDSRDG